MGVGARAVSGASSHAVVAERHAAAAQQLRRHAPAPRVGAAQREAAPLPLRLARPTAAARGLARAVLPNVRRQCSAVVKAGAGARGPPAACPALSLRQPLHRRA